MTAATDTRVLHSRPQVEQTIFEVPRYRFPQHSDVFRDMFLIPQTEDGGAVDGQRRDRPIVLEGYHAAHFAALVRVLYPS